MNVEDNTANYWKKAISIIRNILVVSVLKTKNSGHNISTSSRFLGIKIKLVLVSRGSSYQPSAGLAHLM